MPGDLVKGLAAGKARLLVGSGPSTAAGLPSWPELIGMMTEIISRENSTFPPEDVAAFINKADYLDTAELFREVVGDFAYFRFLRSQYRQKVPPAELHLAIAALPVTTVFTTNYDKLLEAAIREVRGIDPAVIVQPDQLHYIDDDEPRLVKIHGDIDHPASIVLTRRDYAQYAARHAAIVDFFRSSINSTTMLFVGFGLRDPNFVRIYQDARNLYDTTNRQAYALMSHTNAVERKLWRDEGLTILPISEHGLTAPVLGALAKQVEMA